MKPETVVVSLPVADLDRSLRFYRDGLGLPAPEVDEAIVAFELPNLSLFLIEEHAYATYAGRAGLASRSGPVPGACIISCSIGSKDEVDDALARAAAAGGSVAPVDEHDGAYTGYVTDPDGHVWELVHNARTEAAAQTAAT